MGKRKGENEIGIRQDIEIERKTDRVRERDTGQRTGESRGKEREREDMKRYRGGMVMMTMMEVQETFYSPGYVGRE